MFKFVRKQEIFEIGSVKIGGQPGELPTVLIARATFSPNRISILDFYK